jgi:hypothetical protein
MANSDKNILITPATNTSGDPRIVYTPNTAANVITQRLTDSGTLSFEGSAGQLFSITNSLTGTLFSVNDISGIPSIDVADTGLVRIAPFSGTLAIGSTAVVTSGGVSAKGSITTTATTQPGFIVKGIASQSANLIEVQNSSGTVLARFASTGQLLAPSIVGTAFQITSGGVFSNGTTSAPANTQAYFLSTSATNAGLVVRGAASQSANLQEWQTSAGTVLGGVTAAGRLYVQRQEGIQFMDGVATLRSRIYSSGNNGIYFDTGGGAVRVLTLDGGSETITGNLFYPYSSGRIGLIVRGVASQSANLQEWQDSSGNIHSGILSTGFLFVGGSSSAGGQIGITAEAATNRGMVIKGAASQSANLLEIQNSSGTILSRIDSGGNLKATNVATLNSIGQLAESNSGALFVMGRATAQASSPGLNTGTIYFRDGTTAGTLRLATRTGASGVEETIVDNLSSTGSTAGAQFVGAGGINTAGALITTSSVTTGAALNLNYSSPTIASNNASAASIFTGTVTGVTIGSSTIKTTAFPADGTTSTATAGTGYMGMPQNSTTSGAYTVVAADAGKHLYSANTRTVTINSNANLALPVGTTVTFISGPGATTTIAITTDTMYLAGPGTTGSRTLAPFGMATAVKTGTTSWFISGNGLT